MIEHKIIRGSFQETDFLYLYERWRFLGIPFSDWRYVELSFDNIEGRALLEKKIEERAMGECVIGRYKNGRQIPFRA